MFWQVEDVPSVLSVPSVPDFQSIAGVPSVPCFSNDPRYPLSIHFDSKNA